MSNKTASEIEAEINEIRDRVGEQVREIGRRADLTKKTVERRTSQIGVVAIALGVAIGAALIVNLARRK